MNTVFGQRPMFFFFFFNDTATTEIYTLSLHDALPIYRHSGRVLCCSRVPSGLRTIGDGKRKSAERRINCEQHRDRKSTRLNSSHLGISYAVFCLKKKKDHASHDERLRVQ